MVDVVEVSYRWCGSIGAIMHESSPIRSAQFSEKLQDLKGTSDDWTLSEDSKLCSVLEEMEKSLMARVDTAMQKLHAGDAAATRAAVNVANLNARLALFATDQFIESRVYDEPCVTYTEPPRSVKYLQIKEEKRRQAIGLREYYLPDV
ncbi:hypothetical protein Tcan_03996 [Toxocara canis]|uniref:Uncharacterized protein n=1 Tax=Toxocara canis TaxID=6265 RepID=A0A0B2V6S7_TOXCA|nr:hypothetical protein Tcan_03996 [Toxocara canis]